MSILKQHENLGIWQGGLTKFVSATNDHCREARHERGHKFCKQTDAAKNQIFTLFGYKLRKFFLAISPFAIATIFASETSSHLDEKPVTNSMGYFELGLGPAPLPLAVFGTGYRGQRDHHGFDASLQVSTIVIVTHVKTSALYLYYFTPNLQAQFYAGGGLGISGVFHNDWHGRWNSNGFVSPEFIFGKQYTNDTGSLRFFQARLSFPSLSLSRFPKVYYFPLVILSYGVAF